MKCENCKNTGLEREDKVCPVCNGFGGDVESVPAEAIEINVAVDLKPARVYSKPKVGVKEKAKKIIKSLKRK